MQFSARSWGSLGGWLWLILAGALVGLATSACRDIDEPPPEVLDSGDVDGGPDGSDGGLAGLIILSGAQSHAA
ncbi:MAG TPA: hypothetical protein PK156_01910 [Polyangium sp.]|nr:hypothetical protein [Polyangium sp.]